MSNAVNWFEIPAADLGRARKFYETIFEFEMVDFEIPNGPKMAMFPTEQGDVGGALIHEPSFYKPSHDGAVLYLNANPDLGPIIGRVEGAGGKVLQPKTQINEEIGYMAILEDSEGNRIALHSVN